MTGHLRVGLLALLLAFVTAPAMGGQDDKRLETLFDQLRSASNDDDAEPVEEEIWSIWLENPRHDVEVLMQLGIANLFRSRYDVALIAFNRVVELAPDYAEGWNKRANAQFLLGDYTAAVTDIQHVLSLEPRHFAALAGLGLVYLATDDLEAALRAFQGALTINPHLPVVRDEVSKLRQQIAGEPL
jgi:tetratricopeptide (TPR) repeat protein